MPVGPVSRRAVLRGGGSALLTLPFLPSLAGTHARGATPRPPLRLVIVSVPGGTVRESWRAPAEGRFTGALPSILQPLAFAKDALLLLTGLSNTTRSVGLDPHEASAMAHLTAAPIVRREGALPSAGVSVDEAAARLLGAGRPLRIAMAPDECPFSYSSATTPEAYESDPRQIFERLFRTSSGSERRRPTVDLVARDARAVRTGLQASDRRTLAAFVESVDSIERRLNAFEAATGGSLPVLRADPTAHATYVRLASDLAALALQADSTRVATLALGSHDALFPGVVTGGYERHAHSLQHQGNAPRPADADPIARDGCRQVHAWYTALFAEMVWKLANVEDGDGTLLDNTLVLYTSPMADGGHGRDDIPALLVGSLGGRLKTGRQVDLKLGTPVADLYAEMLTLLGTPTPHGAQGPLGLAC